MIFGRGKFSDAGIKSTVTEATSSPPVGRSRHREQQSGKLVANSWELDGRMPIDRENR